MTAPTPKLKAAAVPAVAGTAAVAAAAFVLLRDPHRTGTFVTCPLYALTGILCPGCGSMRATHDALTGDLAEAFAHNLLTVPALVWLGWWWLSWAARAVASRDLPGPPSSRRFSIGLLVFLVVFTVARNLPGSPLAP